MSSSAPICHALQVAEAPASVTASDDRFLRLLPKEDREALPPTVRARFTKCIAAGESVVYRGKVVDTRLSWVGWLLARALTPVGAPLPLDADSSGAAAIVTVTGDPDSGGQFWTRQYSRRRGFPQVIQSTKAFAGPTGLEEKVRGGLGMTLRLRVIERRLVFESVRYFLTVFGRRIYLPRLLGPGRMTITHVDLGASGFAFSLELVHPWFGPLVSQTVLFQATCED